jgi:hypothetical protein
MNELSLPSFPFSLSTKVCRNLIPTKSLLLKVPNSWGAILPFGAYEEKEATETRRVDLFFHINHS